MPCVLSKPLFFCSIKSGVQYEPALLPFDIDGDGGNYHFWLEDKVSGAIYDPSPRPNPLTINGKIEEFYEPFAPEKEHACKRACIHDLHRDFDSPLDYLRRFYENPELKRCFQNAYSILLHQEGARDQYALRCGSFGYLTDDLESLQYCRGKLNANNQKCKRWRMSKVLSLDYGY